MCLLACLLACLLSPWLIDARLCQCGAFKINCAVDRLPNFSCYPSPADGKVGPQHIGTVHFENRMEEIEHAYREASMGMPATRPVIEMTIPSSLDRTISPPGTEQRIGCPRVPMTFLHVLLEGGECGNLTSSVSSGAIFAIVFLPPCGEVPSFLNALCPPSF